MRLFTLVGFCLTLFASQLYAQEICNNSIDDDGDGFIDCYDTDCSSNVVCSDFFLGKDAECQARPDNIPPFQMKLKYKSGVNLTSHLSGLLAGDVDNDGVPELVTPYRNSDVNATVAAVNILQAPATGNMLILDRSINTIPDGFQPSFEDIAMADINKDGCAEIFVLTSAPYGSTYRIIAYDCNGVKIWANPINFTFFPGIMGLADFDGDGYVELYTRTQIFDAHSGALMGQNNIGGGNTNWGRNSNGPIAVDILGSSPGLELVAGCRIYSVSINRPLAPPAIPPSTSMLTLVKSRPEYFTRTSRTTGSATSVADFNQDGYLDVLAVGSDGAYDLNTTIFFWDVKNDVVKKYIDRIGATGDYVNGWKNGAGRINIADIDGDTLMNAVYVSGRYLYALKEGSTQLEMLWRENVMDETSGFTGCTTFDLNGDGKTEVVYRDEDYLWIFNTDESGVVTRHSPVRCASRTYFESPIVADMDGDGSAEICVTCSTTNSTNGKDLTFWDEAEVRVYGSANMPWVPARKVWNQNGYFVVNVNDNLTIPQQQQPHHAILAKHSECRKNGTARPLNTFVSQVPYLNSTGCPSFPAPNLSFVPISPTKLIEYTSFDCLADSIQISFKFTNEGKVGLNSNPLKISFYDGNPMQVTSLAKLIGTKTIMLSGLNPGDVISTTTNIKSQENAFDLYIVINDNGTTLPLDLLSQADRIIECDYDNVISARITPGSVSLDGELFRNNINCISTPGMPNDGAVRAYVSNGSAKDSTNFDFYWSVGSIAKPIASTDHLGSTFKGLGNGSHTVYAIHKILNCQSDTLTISVPGLDLPMDARIILEKEFDNVVNPNGKLRAVINDTDNDGVGDPEINFNFLWIEGDDLLTGDTLGTNATLTGLGAGTYAVLVSHKHSRCYGSAYKEVTCSSSPPTGNQNQSFCFGGTINNLTSSGSAVKWYEANEGGLPLQISVPLLNGTHYYATQTINGCESVTRFEVIAEVNTTTSPTGDQNQSFCIGATISDLISSGSALKWYDKDLGGLLLSGLTPLTDKTYYFASQTLNGCESGTRLRVTAIVNDTPPPTGESMQLVEQGKTFDDLVVQGSDLKWYFTQKDAETRANTLIASDLLVNGSTYFVTQTISDCESTTALAIQVAIITGIESGEKHVAFYPNPVHDILNISFDRVMDNIIILNAMGQKVFSKTVNDQQIDVDFSQWKNGIYLIQIRADETLFYQKVIKQ